MTTDSRDSYKNIFTSATCTVVMAVALSASLLYASTTPGTSPPKTPASKPLQPYSAVYSAELSGVPVGGEAERTLTHNSDGSWTLHFKAEMLFYSFEEESHFTLADGKIKPSSYDMSKGALGRKKTAAIKFDWGKKIADSRENKKNWQVPLQINDLDKISYQEQLRLDANALPAPPKKDKTQSLSSQGFRYFVVDEDERDDYLFRVDGEETLNTPAGRFNTVRLKRVRESKKRETWIWLAPEWDYLLVQLKQTEKGKDYLVSLKQATLADRPVKGQ